MKNFFRNDLELNRKWWHRLTKIIFFLFIGFMALWAYGNFDLNGYSKIGLLSNYITNEPRTVQDIIDDTKIRGVLISTNGEPSKKKDYSFFITRDNICSNNLTNIVQYYKSKNYEFYKGRVFNRIKINPEEFLKYINDNNIKCIIPTFYTGENYEDISMIQTCEDTECFTDNIYLYKPNMLKTMWYFIFGTYFSKSAYTYPGVWFFTIIPALILVFIYYKLILYIIFGSQKNKKS